MLQTLQTMHDEKIVDRIWQKDHTVWSTSPTEISNRLGWLTEPLDMIQHIEEIETFVKEICECGFTNAVLLGMGGSSLAPEVFCKTFGLKDGYLELSVLDTTEPGAIAAQTQALELEKTLFIVSTKSGGTIETISLFKYFYSQVCRELGRENAGKHFIAITDPGSGLEQLANDCQFEHVFLNNPDIGGRFSVLSFFGMVPAGLTGIDLDKFLQRAITMLESSKLPVQLDEITNPAVLLGVAMAEYALAGQDKLTLILSNTLKSFGLWVEQLVAESSGKSGIGILPVDGELPAAADKYGDDRLFVYVKLRGDNGHDESVAQLKEQGFPVFQIELSDIYDIGAEFFRWEMATAVACWRLKVNPFDQPNVEAAKISSKAMLAAYEKDGALPAVEPSFENQKCAVYADSAVSSLAEGLATFLAEAQEKDGSYISIQAYLTPTANLDALLSHLQNAIRDRTRRATTTGYGPRFLHSTGQLHKGDAGNGFFLQLEFQSESDLAIPDTVQNDQSSVSFNTLKNAQSLGDRDALLSCGRKVLRVDLKQDVVSNLEHMIATIEAHE